MFGADKGTPGQLDGRKLSIGIVQARFNEAVTDALFNACLSELLALGVQEKNIAHVKVPGALEVPVALQAMAERDDFDALIALGVQEKNIAHVKVPGALEVPVALQAMAERDDFDALIALGCIIRGETYHFELVANESGAGVTRLALDYQIPIANAILTTENLEQAVARQVDKGRDAARVAVEMAHLLQEIG
jgi:6,7-dimethyl-8-ribityllumazine synthase